MDVKRVAQLQSHITTHGPFKIIGIKLGLCIFCMRWKWSGWSWGPPNTATGRGLNNESINCCLIHGYEDIAATTAVITEDEDERSVPLHHHTEYLHFSVISRISNKRLSWISSAHSWTVSSPPLRPELLTGIDWLGEGWKWFFDKTVLCVMTRFPHPLLHISSLYLPCRRRCRRHLTHMNVCFCSKYYRDIL